MDMSDQYRLRDNSPDMETPTNLSSLDADLFQTTIDSWAHERLDIVLSEFCPDICPWDAIVVALPVFTYEQN